MLADTLQSIQTLLGVARMKWQDRRLLDLFGIEHPILQAPMAGVTSPQMAIAASEAGALGGIAAAMLTPEGTRQELQMVKQGTGRPFSTFDGIEPMSYLESPSSLPVWCDLRDYDQRLAITDPGMHEILFQSRGLEAAVSIPAWDGDLPRGTAGDHVLAATA